MKKTFLGPFVVVVVYIVTLLSVSLFLGTTATYVSLPLLFVALYFVLALYQNTVLKKYLAISNPAQAQAYLEKAVENCIFPGVQVGLQSALLVHYLKQGNHNKALQLFALQPRLKRLSTASYAQLVLCLYYNYTQNTQELLEKIQKIKHPNAESQKQAANQLVAMVETGVFDQNLFDITSIPAVKEICLRYKIDKTENAEPLVVEDGDLAYLVEDKRLPQEQKKRTPWVTAINVATIVLFFVQLYVQEAIKGTTDTFLPWLAVCFALVPFGAMIFAVIKGNKYKTISTFIVGLIVLVYSVMFVLLTIAVNNGGM